MFKTCPNCKTEWESRDDFLADESVELNGYQVSLKNLPSGLFLFTHMHDSCKSTMGIHVTDFNDMYTGERYAINKALSPECPRYCIDEKRMDRCDVHCECAFVREIINIIRNIRKIKE